MKQWICIEEGNFLILKVSKGQIFWVDKIEYRGLNYNSANYELFSENKKRFIISIIDENFEKHFIPLSEYREKQLEEILK